jgi:hypothetical protein
MRFMTTAEFCASFGLTPREVQTWIENGLLDAEMVGRTAGGGQRREFSRDQVERACLLMALPARGAELSQLALADLAFDVQAYVVYDGHELRTCRDAAAAIAAVVRPKRPCSAVDLSAIRGHSTQ